MTEKSQTNLIGSITSTTENFPHDKTVRRTNESSKFVNKVKAHTTGKTNNMEKAFLLFKRSKN